MKAKRSFGWLICGVLSGILVGYLITFIATPPGPDFYNRLSPEKAASYHEELLFKRTLVGALVGFVCGLILDRLRGTEKVSGSFLKKKPREPSQD